MKKIGYNFKIAFVGVTKKYSDLDPDYKWMFTQYHLELPYYFAMHPAKNDIVIATEDFESCSFSFGGCAPNKSGRGYITHELKENVQKNLDYFDFVIHWRKWIPEMYSPNSINLLLSQDHSYGPEWKATVKEAFDSGKLHGILCFPTWHKRNLHEETGIPLDRLFDGVTLGVDTDIYAPSEKKDPFQMLWASDPGRGFSGAVELLLKLWQRDKRFVLNVCYPDYVKGMNPISHPGIKFHGNVPNGPKLWKLFNDCGILPYTSVFKEPSSRAHRQAQAAGSLVLYPPGMGSPSELIESDRTGIVAPTSEWVDIIMEYVVKTDKWKKIGEQAREMAVSENWAVQAERFNTLLKKIKESTR